MSLQEFELRAHVLVEEFAAVRLEVIRCEQIELNSPRGIRSAALRATSAETMLSLDPAITSVGTATLRAGDSGRQYGIFGSTRANTLFSQHTPGMACSRAMPSQASGSVSAARSPGRPTAGR